MNPGVSIVAVSATLCAISCSSVDYDCLHVLSVRVTGRQKSPGGEERRHATDCAQCEGVNESKTKFHRVTRREQKTDRTSSQCAGENGARDESPPSDNKPKPLSSNTDRKLDNTELPFVDKGSREAN